MIKLQDKRKICFAIFSNDILFLLFPASALSQSNNPKVTITYFYENVCGSCNPEKEFIDLFNQLVGDHKEGIEVEVSMHNIFHDSGAKLMDDYLQKFDVQKISKVRPWYSLVIHSCQDRKRLKIA